jgi:carbon storage regulator
MLVLSRKSGEEIVVDNDITVTVIEIRGGRVKLGFEGPSEIPIHRKEIYCRIADLNKPQRIKTKKLACLPVAT